MALVVGIAEVLAGFGTQWGVWHFRTGFVILRWAAYIGGAAGVILLVNFFVSVKVKKRRNLILSIVGLLMANLTSSSSAAMAATWAPSSTLVMHRIMGSSVAAGGEPEKYCK